MRLPPPALSSRAAQANGRHQPPAGAPAGRMRMLRGSRAPALPSEAMVGEPQADREAPFQHISAGDDPALKQGVVPGQAQQH